MILLAAALLLPGCGRVGQPTVRQTSVQSEDGGTAATAADAPQPADDCPARELHVIRPKRDLPRIANNHPAITGGAKGLKPAGPATVRVDGAKVRIGPVYLLAPSTWTREQGPAELPIAEFSLPRANGDKADAQVTVAAAGGTDPKSLESLRENLKAKPGEGSAERFQISGSDVVLVDSSGDYGDASDPLPSPVGEGRYRNLSATVFVGGQVYFVNCTGPEKTVGERAGEFRAFLQTMKPVDKP
jgi:hypothetical protein